MKRLIRSGIASFLMCMIALSAAAQSEVMLEPSKDNTLYQDVEGAFSNGAGNHMFAGRTNESTNFLRRALVHFDVSQIPAGSTANTVELTMRMSRAISGAHSIALHRVSVDWGESTSDAPGQEGGNPRAAAEPGDATWIHTFSPSSNWQTAGGDFEPSASATASVAGVGNYTWTSTAALVSDVQQWVDNASSNFGWIVIGAEDIATSAKRFDTRESTSPPQLRIQYQPPNVAIEEDSEVPQLVSLRSTYPNPFRQATTIEYELAEPRNVVLEVYDTLGRLVETLADGVHSAGKHVAVLSANDLPAGVYFFRLESGETTRYRQVVLTR